MEIIPIAHFPKGNLLRSRERRCDIYVAGARVTNQLIPGPSRRRLYYRRRVYCLESRCKKNYCLHCIMGVARVAPGSVVAGGAVTARKCGQMQHNTAPGWLQEVKELPERMRHVQGGPGKNNTIRRLCTVRK